MRLVRDSKGLDQVIPAAAGFPETRFLGPERCISSPTFLQNSREGM
jgi:hypothetical protein